MDECGRAGSQSARIGTTALVVGAIAFVAGFVGPIILYPESNLGPLLGIFVTGPIGVLVGALVGIAWSASAPPEGPMRVELTWLAGAWAVSLLFTLASSIGGLGFVSLGLQAAVIVTAVHVFYGRNVRPLPGMVRPYRLPILVAGLLTMVSTIYPPTWSKTTGERLFTCFLDPRFDASRNVPDYTIDSATLALEWLLFAALALVSGYLLASLGERTRQ